MRRCITKRGPDRIMPAASRRLGPDLLRSLVVPMTDFDGPKDPSWLLAFDWVQLNKLHRAYKDGGDDALEGACRDLMNNDLLQFARIACAYMPDHMPQRIKGTLEDDGYTLQGLIERTGHEETTLGPRLPAEGQAWLNGLNPFCRRAVEHDANLATCYCSNNCRNTLSIEIVEAGATCRSENRPAPSTIICCRRTMRYGCSWRGCTAT